MSKLPLASLPPPPPTDSANPPLTGSAYEHYIAKQKEQQEVFSKSLQESTKGKSKTKDKKTDVKKDHLKPKGGAVTSNTAKASAKANKHKEDCSTANPEEKVGLSARDIIRIMEIIKATAVVGEVNVRASLIRTFGMLAVT